MITDGEWGQFFPMDVSPYAYNESVAQQYYPSTKSAVGKWRDEDMTVKNVTKVIEGKDLPGSINNIPDDILNWAIRCNVTGRPFKITPHELKFYREMNFPIPQLHPDQRHQNRIKQLQGNMLYERTCTKCAKNIQTTYAPDRPEIVYCEECYLKEVY